MLRASIARDGVSCPCAAHAWLADNCGIPTPAGWPVWIGLRMLVCVGHVPLTSVRARPCESANVPVTLGASNSLCL